MGFSERFLILIRSFAFCHYGIGFLLFIFGWQWGLTDPILFGIPIFLYCLAVVLSRKAFQNWEGRSLLQKVASIPHLPLAIILLFLSLNFLFCLMPPAENLEGDALNYHLVIPWQYYLRGAVTYLDWSVADKYPLYLQMAQLPFTVATFPWIVKFWNLFTVPALMVLLYSFLSSFKIPLFQKSYLLALTSGLALFVIQYGSAMFDLANALYALFAFYYLTRAVKTEGRGDLFCGTLFMGMASATKTISLYFAFVWAFSFLVWRLCQTPRRFRSFDGLLLGGPFVTALLFLAPVWLRNTIHTGNPIFPLLSNFFHSPFDNGGILEGVRYEFGYGYSLLDYFLLPIRLVLPVRKFDYWTDPLLLVFLVGAVLFFRKRWKDIYGLVFLSALFLFSAIFLITQQARFFYPFWFLIIVLGGRWIFLHFGKRVLTLLLLGQAFIGLSLFFYFHRQAVGWLREGGNYLSKASYSYVWNRELKGLNVRQLCLRHVEHNFASDILYFEVPVKLIQHFNTTLRLTNANATEGCDFFMIGNQDYKGMREDPKNRGTLVSKEMFLRLPQKVH